MCICFLITACDFRCLFDFCILMDAPYTVLVYGLHLVLLLFYFLTFLLFYLISFYCDMDRWSDANK